MASSQSFGSGNNESSASGPSTSLPQVFPVPLEILEEIFLHLPPHQVVGVCRSVCRQWREVSDSESLWKERCRREGYRPRDPSKMTKNWGLFYFLCKKRRNLLKNPKAEHGMTDWQILGDGDRWCVEEVRVPHPNETVQKNFVTTYGMCMKSQLIDLEEEGYNPSLMDRFQPEIRIYDWYAPRRDCGSKYEICVTLLNKKKEACQDVCSQDNLLRFVGQSELDSDYPCIPELWARSEVHQLYTWRQGQAALGTMVQDSRH
uniref:Uncharacterized protein n=1 Tax=Gasterosteus aculeatus aculeatus TaxID=481459 RepID=A0AAQ4REF6_GASAC